MRIRNLTALLIVAALALTACNTRGSRSRSQQELFDSYPPEVQQNIRDGVIEVGYTREMVVMALGEPDRKIEAKPEDELREVWIYQTPGFGIGMGTGGYVGSGVSIGTGDTTGKPARSEDRAVVEFEGDRVKSLETAGGN